MILIESSKITIAETRYVGVPGYLQRSRAHDADEIGRLCVLVGLYKDADCMPLSNPYLITSTHTELANLSFVTSAHEDLLNLSLDKINTITDWNGVKILHTESKQIKESDVLKIISTLKMKSPVLHQFITHPWNEIQSTIDSGFDKLNTDEYGDRPQSEVQTVKRIFKYIHDKWLEIASIRREPARRRLDSYMRRCIVPDHA